MNTNNKIEIVKIPNNSKDSTDNKMMNANFERYPRQYLELLENKDKVKSEMVNKDYDPDEALSVKEFERNIGGGLGGGHQNRNQMDQRVGKITEEDDEDLLSISDVEDNTKDDLESNNEMSGSEDADDEDEDDEEEEDEEEEFDLDDDDDDDAFKGKQDYDEDESVSGGNQTKEKLKQMFHPEGPKLSDLVDNTSSRTIPNINMMADSEDDDEDKKRELIFKFNLLRRSYKNVDIPEFTIHSPYKKMNDSYEMTLRMLSLDSSVEQFKQILIGGFMLTEYLMGYLRFDMEGFTKAQILQLASYERLLLELGQKSYVPTDQQLPVEIRLIGLILLNAVIFIISKLILKKTGTNLMSMLNHNVRDKYTQNVESNYNNNINQMKNPYEFTSPVSNTSEVPKHNTEQRKMKRPTFDFASL